MKLDYIYHVGHLALDREFRHLNYYTSVIGPRTEEADAVHERALKAMQASDAGKVELYQRRVRDGFEYHMRAIRGT